MNQNALSILIKAREKRKKQKGQMAPAQREPLLLQAAQGVSNPLEVLAAEMVSYRRQHLLQKRTQQSERQAGLRRPVVSSDFQEVKERN